MPGHHHHSHLDDLPFAAVFVVVRYALLEILRETAGAVVLGILAPGGPHSGTVFTKAKDTPLVQARIIWGPQPVAYVATSPLSFTNLAVADAPSAVPSPVVEGAAEQLNGEVDAIRGRHISTGTPTVGDA